MFSTAMAIALLLPSASFGDVILACSFPSIPDVVLHYPESPDQKPTMTVAARPPIEMFVGVGSARYESATIDGYFFRFSPSKSSIVIEVDGRVIKTESGHCVTIDSRVNATPLTISAAEVEVTSTETVAEPLLVETEPAKSTEDMEPDPAPVAGTGKWVVSESKSAFDDSRTVILRLDADDSVAKQFGGNDYPRIFLRCMENTTSAYVTLADHFLSDIQGYGRVDFRIDARKATHSNMQVSTDNKALGLWSGGEAIPFIKTLTSGDEAALRVTPFNESSIEFHLSLQGLEQALIPLREACKW